MNLSNEVYTLEQLRKMNCLDGGKELIFLHQVNKYLNDRERIHQINLECAREGAKQQVLDKLSEHRVRTGCILINENAFGLLKKELR